MYKFIGIKGEDTIDFQMLKMESTLDLMTGKDRKHLTTFECGFHYKFTFF